MVAVTVVDCFLFADELDMLECRLTELDPVVDYFVLVESPQTFQGHHKRCHYLDNRDRFEKWNHKIVNVVQNAVVTDDPWAREALCREALTQGVKQLAPAWDDVIVLSDVDEIWRNNLMVEALPGPYTVLDMNMYVYNYGWRHPDPWAGSVVCRYENLPPGELGTWQALRSIRLSSVPLHIKNAGWHLSWFGGTSACKKKLGSFSHTEFRNVEIDKAAKNGIHVDGTPLESVNPGWDVPAYSVRGWWP